MRMNLYRASCTETVIVTQLDCMCENGLRYVTGNLLHKIIAYSRHRLLASGQCVAGLQRAMELSVNLRACTLSLRYHSSPTYAVLIRWRHSVHLAAPPVGQTLPRHVGDTDRTSSSWPWTRSMTSMGYLALVSIDHVRVEPASHFQSFPPPRGSEDAGRNPVVEWTEISADWSVENGVNAVCRSLSHFCSASLSISLSSARFHNLMSLTLVRNLWYEPKSMRRLDHCNSSDRQTTNQSGIGDKITRLRMLQRLLERTWKLKCN
jgi:hypothetical protein